MNLNLKDIKDEDLLKLKEDIDAQLLYNKNVKSKIESTKWKNKLADLTKDDYIFCINFRGSKIYNMDYVKINFNKKAGSDYINFSTSDETLPMGCSSAILYECMDNHYFLSEFSSSTMYFFTIKPETWKEDLFSELNRLAEVRKLNYKKELREFNTFINDLIENGEDVDNYITKIQ
jgi:hypothetical protein